VHLTLIEILHQIVTDEGRENVPEAQGGGDIEFYAWLLNI
jgi:hypothetical protein